MRLLAGILMLDGQNVSLERLTGMCDAMRAPVEHPAHSRARATIFQQGAIGLAVLESAGEPDSLIKRPSGLILAGDVRLDERADLLRELGQPSEFETKTPRAGNRGYEDAVLAAESLERWGDDVGLKLLGDFALAAWKPRSHELVLMRDHMGIRPIVYAWQPGKHFVFASFPTGVHASGLVKRELDKVAFVHSFFVQRQAGETLSLGVKELPPGHLLTLKSSGLECSLQIRKYWEPTSKKQRHSSPEEAAAELRTLITAAVESRVESAGSGRVAAHLSGGLDSSAVAVLANRKLVAHGQRLLAYSFLMKPQDGVIHDDESPYVEAVLEQEPEIEWKAVWPPDTAAYLTGNTDADWGLSLLPDDPENVVCADASANGASLLLSGWGGDEGVTFNGRGALADAFLRGRWMYCAQEIMAAKRVRGISRRATLRGEVLGQAAPRWLTRMLGLRGATRSFNAAGLSMLSETMLSAARSLPLDWLEPAPHLRQNQLRLLTSPHLAVRTTNWASIGARFGQAFTFPMLDRRIVDFALSLPTTWHIRDARKRRIFRDAMQGILPEKIRWRFDKLTPFPTAAGNELRQTPERLRIAERLAEHPMVQQIFNMKTVRAGVESVRTSKDEDSPVFVNAYVALGFAQYIEEHFPANFQESSAPITERDTLFP